MPQIWTPGGMVDTERQEVQVPAQWLQACADFAEDAADIGWGLHCSRCKQDISGRNASADKHWKLECACRTYIGNSSMVRS